MDSVEKRWVWQGESWPNVPWDSGRFWGTLAVAHSRIDALLAAMTGLGFKLRVQDEARGAATEAVRTAEIEGHQLDWDSVRSSVARRLGIEPPAQATAPASREIDGLVDVLLDASQGAASPLTRERILGWHAALFPGGWSGMRRITPGAFRGTDTPVQVVSGPIGHETVHFVAPPGDRLDSEVDSFLEWFASPPPDLDWLVMAAIAHFRFVSIHPFEDGNGRIARVIADMAISRAIGQSGRHISISAAIMKDRQRYYRELHSASGADCDLTDWIEWFLNCVVIAVDDSRDQVDAALAKARFWQDHGGSPLNRRQAKIINRMLEAGPEGFEGGMTTRKAAHLTGAGTATAFRDLLDLVGKGLLVQNSGGGRSTSYRLNIT